MKTIPSDKAERPAGLRYGSLTRSGSIKLMKKSEESISTPRSSVSKQDSSTGTNTSSSGKLKNIFKRHKVDNHEHETTRGRLQLHHSTSRTGSVELPPITSIRTKDHSRSKRAANSAESSPSFGDDISFNMSGTKSEANSLLNLQIHTSPTAHQLNSERGSKSALTNNSAGSDIHSSISQASENKERENKQGLISTLFNAAADHIGTINNYEDDQANTTSTPSKLFVDTRNRIGDVFATIRSTTGTTTSNHNLTANQKAAADPYDAHIQDLVASSSHQNSPNPRIVVESPTTKNIVFEPMKQTPLSTLGEGDLSLADFENKRPSLTPANYESGTTTATINRVLSPNGRAERRSSKSPLRGRMLSPGLSARMSGSVDDHKRRLSKRMSKRASDSNMGAEEEDLSPTSSKFTTVTARARAKSQKLTIASTKRQQEFHALFKQIPSQENLLEDYSCALQKEILVHGRMYISTKHICFNSNILGWVTNFVTPLSEVIQIEKKNTAGVFPNAISIQTLHSKSVFASFLSRESTFDAITLVWNQNIHAGSVSGSIYAYESDSDAEEPDVDDEDDEDDEDEDDDESEDSSSSNMDSDVSNDGSSNINSENAEVDTEETEASSGAADKQVFNGITYRGPSQHGPTESYEQQSGETLILEETLSAPVGAVYELLFGDNSSFLKSVLEKSKNFDLSEIPPFSSKKRQYSYTKPLGGPVGPKQTRCNITETIDQCEFDKSIRVTQVSHTPDVPSGSSFTVRSVIALSWAKNNSTKLVVVTAVDWTGKSWIKGAVEKGSIDGQKESMKVLLAELKSKVSSASSRKRTVTDGKKKKREKDEEEDEAEPEAAKEKVAQSYLSMVTSFIPQIAQIPILAIISALVIYLLIPARKAQPKGDFINLPSSFNSDNYLIDKAEYDIWNWINKRNGQSVEHKKINGYSRQTIEEAVEITQLKLDELRRILDE